MKIDLDRVQRPFHDALRRANCQVWDTLHPFVEFAVRAGSECDHYGQTLGLNVDNELTDEDAPKKLAALSDAIGSAVSDYVQAPGKLVVELLQKSDVHDVQIPAGCNPGSPQEVRSAFKRAADYLRARIRPNSFTILIPAGSQEWFYAALDGDTPARMPGGEVVRLVPTPDLIDGKAIDDALPDSGATPQQYLDALDAAAKAASWYVIGHTRKKPFLYTERQRLELRGPDLSVSARFSVTATDALKSNVVRVSPSRLVIAQDMKTAPVAVSQ